MEVVSARHPTDAEWDELLFAWKVCKHVRSNAIVFTRELASVGIGAGQMSRVDSVRLAIEKAQVGPIGGAVLASDAFFPFADGPQLAIEAGVTAIIQPGGSIRDQEVVEAIDAAGAAMVFTAGATSGIELLCGSAAIRPPRGRSRTGSAAWSQAERCGVRRRDDLGRRRRRGARRHPRTSSPSRSCARSSTSSRAWARPLADVVQTRCVRDRHLPLPTRSAAPTARCSATSGRR